MQRSRGTPSTPSSTLALTYLQAGFFSHPRNLSTLLAQPFRKGRNSHARVLFHVLPQRIPLPVSRVMHHHLVVIVVVRFAFEDLQLKRTLWRMATMLASHPDVVGILGIGLLYIQP